MKTMIPALLALCCLVLCIAGMDSKTPNHTRPSKILHVQSMYMDNLQYHLHKRDINTALCFARFIKPIPSQFSGMEDECLELQNILRRHVVTEDIVEEAFQLPMFDTVEDAQAALKFTPEALASIKAQRQGILDKLHKSQESSRQIKQQLDQNENEFLAYHTSYFKSTFFGGWRQYYLDLSLALGEKYAAEISFQSKMNSQLEHLNTDPNVHSKFIRKNSKLFVKKNYYLPNRYGTFINEGIFNNEASDQIVNVFDIFGNDLPEDLKRYCHNTSDFSESKFRSNGMHGFQVSRVLVNRCKSKFFAIDFGEYSRRASGPFHKTQEDLPLITADINELSQRGLERIENLYLSGHHRFYVKIDSSYFLIDCANFPTLPGKIINLSCMYCDCVKSIHDINCPLRTANHISTAFLLIKLIKEGMIIVWCAGNEATVIAKSLEYKFFKTFAQMYPRSFIVALALSFDHSFMSNFSNQPGEHEVNGMCLCAPGYFFEGEGASTKTISGTSFSAPYICSMAAVLASNFPQATSRDIIDALLDNATPVVMKKNTSRLYRVPYFLHETTSKDLKPGTYQYLTKDGKRLKKIKVAQWMIREGRSKYGVGILHLQRALEALQKKYSP